MLLYTYIINAEPIYGYLYPFSVHVVTFTFHYQHMHLLLKNKKIKKERTVRNQTPHRQVHRKYTHTDNIPPHTEMRRGRHADT